MGKYGKSIHCILKVKSQLEAMYQHRDKNTFSFKSDSPSFDAHAIRQAFHYLNSEAFDTEKWPQHAHLKEIASLFRLREKPGLIVVEKKVVMASLIDESLRDIRSISEANLAGNSDNTVTVHEIADLISLVGYISAHKHLSHISFPNVVLSEKDKAKLIKWAESNSYLIERLDELPVLISKVALDIST